ncbi:hypothetical protein BDW22DRAFT_1362935 [Trametopsis cervina]|nr:hypothetical protein BDW22DRAFT_1362935 [Trametopsis cervina]
MHLVSYLDTLMPPAHSCWGRPPYSMHNNPPPSLLGHPSASPSDTGMIQRAQRAL